MGSSRSEVLEQLARRIRAIESGQRPRQRSRVSTGIAPLDELLPERGLRRGTLVEFLSATAGAGAWTLGMLVAKQSCGEQKTLVVVDSEKEFYPPAAARLGLELDRLIVVRPDDRRDGYRAAVQALRCAAVGAVLGWHGRLSMFDLRRLQLAVEAGGGVGILLRPAGTLRVPSCAAVRLRVSAVGKAQGEERRAESQSTKDERRQTKDGGQNSRVKNPWRLDPHLSPLVSRLPSSGPRLSPLASRPTALDPRLPSRRLRVDIVRCRGGRCGQSLLLEIDDETGHVHLPALVADRTAVAPAALPAG